MLKKVRIDVFSKQRFRFWIKCIHEIFNEKPLIKKAKMTHKCYICHLKIPNGSKYYIIHGRTCCSESCFQKVIQEENDKRIIREAREQLEPLRWDDRFTHIKYDGHILPL
jgi:hypothetical protein